MAKRFLFLILLGLVTTACAPSKPSTFSDPFAYCSSVGSIDKPDTRYTGETVPEAIIQGYMTAADLKASTEPVDMFKKTTIWRCMGGKVYACNFGANLPCDSKADTNKTPTQAMTEFCTANPGSDFIPMAVTGHATVFSWRCNKDKPEAAEQIVQVDASGYLANIWYLLEAKP